MNLPPDAGNHEPSVRAELLASAQSATPGDAFVGLLLATLALGLWALTIERIGFERRQTIVEATRQNSNLALALEEQTVRTLKAVDQRLGFMKYEYERAGVTARLEQLVHDAESDDDMLTNLAIVDEHGDRVVSRVASKSNRVTDRDYFAVQRNSRPEGLYIGTPVVGRDTGRWAFHVSRRLEKSDGSFGGVVFAAMNPEYFTKLYQQADLGPHGVISLIGFDGIARARRVGSVHSTGEDMRDTPLMKRQALIPSGALNPVGKFDGIKRLISYRSLSQFPLVVAVGTAEAEVLAAFHQRERNYYAVAGATTLLAILLSLAYLVVLRRQRRAVEALADSENRYRGIFEGAVEGIFQTTPEGKFIAANPAMARLLGYATAESLITERTDISTQGFVLPEKREEFKRLIECDGSVEGFEYEMIRKDGSRAWVSETARLTRGARTGKALYEGFLQDITARKLAEDKLREADLRAIEEYERLLERLSSLAQDLATATDLASVFGPVLAFIRKSAPCEALLVSIHDVDKDERRPVFAWHLHADPQAALPPAAWLSDGTEGDAIRSGSIVVVARVGPAPTSLIVPLAVMGKVFGSMRIDCDASVPTGFSTEHFTALRVAAHLAGNAVETVRLVDDERRLRREAQESEGRKAAILESALDAILTIDHQGRILEFNGAAERIFGIGRDAAIGQEMASLIVPPDLRAMHRAGMSRYLATGQAKVLNQRLEIRAQRADGAIFPVELSISRIGQSDPPRFTGFIRDITERKQAQDTLRESEERFKNVAMATTDAVWDWDLKTDAVWWSEGMTTLFGHSPSELEPDSVSWTGRIHPDDRAQELRLISQAIADAAKNYSSEYRFRRRDGSYAYVHDRGFVIRNAQGEAVRMVGGMTDLSERRLAEEARGSLEVQLRESQKMEAIGRLAGGVAHDFNNILGAILGNVELAREGVDELPAVCECLDEIRKAGHRARALIQQILSFSRKQPTEREVIALAPIVEESARLLRATLPARVQIDSWCSPDTPGVLADTTQLQQVLINLGTNAAYATGNRIGHIEIRAERVILDDAAPISGLKPGEYARVTVKDNGEGMSAETRSRIFEPFFTTKPVGEGTGLGLAVVHGIVRTHEGAIAVQSEPGFGCTFELYFPASLLPAVSRKALRAGSEVIGSGQRVLYIDDDEALVFLVKRMLERRGFRVSSFTDQREALDALRDDPEGFDLVVTDYNMPGMSGVDVALACRELAPQVPVALASGYITDEMREEALLAGVRELIFKPDVVEKFLDVVERLLRQQENPAQCAAAE